MPCFMNEKTHKTLHNYAIIWPMWWSRGWVTTPRPRILGSNPGCVMNVVLIGCAILIYQRLELWMESGFPVAFKAKEFAQL